MGVFCNRSLYIVFVVKNGFVRVFLGLSYQIDLYIASYPCYSSLLVEQKGS